MAEDYGTALASPDQKTLKDTDLPGYKYAKALADSARAAANKYVRSFRDNWRYLLGQDHHAIPATAAAIMQDQWQCKGLRNYLFAVHQSKASVIMGATPTVIVEPLDEQSNYYQRLLIASVIEKDLNRMNWRKVSRDVYNWGAACGVGVAMFRVVPDRLTGDMAIELLPINPDEFFIDPSADDLKDPRCRFVVWEPILDMSEVRRISRSKGPQVKPLLQTVPSQSESGGYTYSSGNVDQNLIYGTAGEFMVDQTSRLQSRRARVCFVWIRDTDTLIEELQEVVLEQAIPAYTCLECGTQHAASEEITDATPCPLCGADMVRSEIPAKVRQSKTIRRAYPYGRLIIYSGDTLLYDGPHDLEIESVFPFAAYRHYEVPGVFYGYGDVTLLKTSQMVADRTIGQVVDYVRLAVNGPIVVPMGEQAWSKLGNAPNQIMPMKPQNCNLVRYLSPQNFNVQAVDLLERMTQRDFQIVSGFTDPVAGLQSPFPISSEQSQMQVSGFSTRTHDHRIRMDEFQSELASIDWQLIRQFYPNAQTVPVTMPNTELKAIEAEVATLPTGVTVRVLASLEAMQKDKNLGQNMVATGLLQTAPDIALPKILGDAETVRQLLERAHTQNELSPGTPMQSPLAMAPTPPAGGAGG